MTIRDEDKLMYSTDEKVPNTSTRGDTCVEILLNPGTFIGKIGHLLRKSTIDDPHGALVPMVRKEYDS